MNLPKCPHCEKLLVPVMTQNFTVKGISDEPKLRDFDSIVIYFCPETLKEQDPDWVEVLEV